MRPPAGALGPRDLAAALVVVVIWGLNFVAMKIALRDFTPFQLGFFRFAFAVVPLVFLVRPPRVPARWVVAAGIGQFGQFAFLFLALQAGMTAALASVLMQTQVFFTALLGAALLGERVPGPLRAGLVLAAIGLACFAMHFTGVAGAGTGVTLGALLLGLCSPAMWGAANIVARRAQAVAPGYDPLAFVVWMALVPLAPFALLALAAEPATTRWQWLHAGALAWGCVALLGWVATVAAYALWTSLLQRHPANRVAPFSLGVPLVGVAAGMAMLGERVTPWQWAGSAFVVAALAAVLFGGRWRRAPAARSASADDVRASRAGRIERGGSATQPRD